MYKIVITLLKILVNSTTPSNMQLIIPFFAFFGLITVIQCEKVNYDNYRVFSIYPKNEDQLELLQSIENTRDDLIFLNSPSVHIATDIIVSPQKSDFIEALLHRHGLAFEIKSNNLQK